MKNINITTAIHDLVDASGKGISISSISGWKCEYIKGSSYVLGKGKGSSIPAEHYPAFKEYIERKIEAYTPNKRSVKPQEKPSEVKSAMSLVSQLEANVKALRAWGYGVTCSVQMPPKEL